MVDGGIVRHVERQTNPSGLNWQVRERMADTASTESQAALTGTVTGEDAGRSFGSAIVLTTIAAAASIILVVHAWHFMPFLSDDSLISLRYAERLLNGHGLTWTDGPRVEGYSNLLWILLVAGLGVVHVDLVVATRILGVVCHALVIGALLARYWTVERSGRIPAMVAATLTFTLAAPVAVWTIGGMEQPLLAALLAWSLVLFTCWQEDASPSDWTVHALSMALGLLCLTRPDGPLFTVGVLLALAVSRGIGRRLLADGLRVLVFPAMCTLGQLLFRLAYYGEVVPNTALVKIAPSWHHVSKGVAYVFDGLRALSPISVVSLAMLVVMLAHRRCRLRAVLSVSIVLIWLAYLALVGGDLFPAFRHFVPVVVVMAVVIGDGVSILWSRVGTPVVRLAVAALLLFAIPPYVLGQLNHDQTRRAMDERWEWNGKALGFMLGQAFAEQQPLFAVTAAGCLPYWSRLPSLDLLGLNDYHLPRHPPEGFGQGPLGHELGDGDYVLDRRPDLISFCGPHGGIEACFLSGKLVQQDPRFYAEYTPVRFLGTDPHEFVGIVWVRKHSPKIGIRRDGDTIRVPGFLINGNPSTVAHLDSAGRLVVSVSRERPALLELVLPPGEWEVRVDTARPEVVRVDVADGTHRTKLVRLSHPDAGSADIRHVWLRRTSRLEISGQEPR